MLSVFNYSLSLVVETSVACFVNVIIKLIDKYPKTIVKMKTTSIPLSIRYSIIMHRPKILSENFYRVHVDCFQLPKEFKF